MLYNLYLLLMLKIVTSLLTYLYFNITNMNLILIEYSFDFKNLNVYKIKKINITIKKVTEKHLIL